MNHRRMLLLVSVLSSLDASCFFLSDFDNLEGGTASSGGSGAGGDPTSTSTTTSMGGDHAGGGGATTDGGANTGGGGSPELGGGGSGGGGALCPPPGVNYTGLVLNEMAPKGIPEDSIELRNNSAASIPLCAVFITQGYDGITAPGGGDRYTFGQVDIGAGQYLVIRSVVDFPFGLAKDEVERVTMFAPDGTPLDDTTYVADAVTPYDATESWARIPDATGPFERIASPTKGGENADVGGTGGTGGI